MYLYHFYDKRSGPFKSLTSIEPEEAKRVMQQMKAEGKTNKEIYTELGVSKALFYLRMKEYK